MADAVVIGSGPNGLVAANMLADAGWEVLVLEAHDRPGGAVQSGELVEPGFVSDLFSAFYPLAGASPFIAGMELERFGLRWRRSDVVVAHPTLDGSCALVSLDPAETTASMEAFAPGDGAAWEELYGQWERVGRDVLRLLFDPFPPVRALGRLARKLSYDEGLRFARMALMGVRRLGEERFSGAGGPRLLASNALHADLSPEAAPSAIYGWVLCSLAQQVGFPAPEGGAGGLSQALARRLESLGGRVVCGARATAIEVRDGRARAVLHGAGERADARRAVLADTGAPQLYLELLAGERLPARLLEDLRRFQYDNSTVKVDWTLDGPIPWTAEGARRAGTVHVAEGVDGLTQQAAELACRLIPERPYLVMGQYAHFDPTRAPEGRETAWAYTRVPQAARGDAGGELTGRWDEDETARFTERIEDEIEALAPGFRSLIRRRHVFVPRTMEQVNGNLVGGAINGGTSQLHQQLVFRPTPTLAVPDTPVEGLFLASASAHPGGGVHGACGANAAKAALAANSRRPRPMARLSRALQS
jgi:phytoene dehydrogenase-like protein